MTLDDAITSIQVAYPQVYYACHTRHARKRSSPFNLSRRDSEVLVHLDRTVPTSLSALAHHMDLSPSTLSEAVSKLVAHGYLLKPAAGADRRRLGIVLTAKGLHAVLSSSVLEPARLKAVLERLPPRDVAAVAKGLGLLAAACRPSGRRRQG